MKIIDVTLPLTSSLVVWPGEQGLRTRPVRTFSKDGVRVSNLSFGAHTGTHLDAPAHFLSSGKPLETIPLDNLVGPCRVLRLNIGKRKEVEVKDLARFHIKRGERLLFNLGNGKHLLTKRFYQDYGAIGNDAAKFLAAKKIKLVGVDYLSVERRGNPGHPVHKSLLRAGVAIVEGVNLTGVKPGKYTLVCLPLKIIGIEASPVRAILLK
ncbi:MAG: cyclase family protein [Patescibacteria group bacterium]